MFFSLSLFLFCLGAAGAASVNRPTPALTSATNTTSHEECKNRTVPMGFVPGCDDAKTNLLLDYCSECSECSEWPKWRGGNATPLLSIVPGINPKCDPEIRHVCMNESIHYKESPPSRGDHRPNWAQYGEYHFLPPQRWLHNIEHGGVVMLYHPCADWRRVEALRQIVRRCLYRHIITQYAPLDKQRPLALITWATKLELDIIDVNAVVEFIKTHALRHAPEDLSNEGTYDFLLLQAAHIVSDTNDTNLCPFAFDIIRNITLS